MDTTHYQFANTRDMRYGEILVFKQAHIDVYNTTGMNDCPAELWDALDPEKLKKELHAHKVIKNRPHYWMMDSMTAEFGDKASFEGLDARWAAKLGFHIAIKAAHGSVPYKVFEPKKTQKLVYSAGKPVYELVGPDGKAYVLQAHDKAHPIESLVELGQQMKQLPKGWQYRTRTLTADLVLDLKPDQTIYAVGTSSFSTTPPPSVARPGQQPRRTSWRCWRRHRSNPCDRRDRAVLAPSHQSQSSHKEV